MPTSANRIFNTATAVVILLLWTVPERVTGITGKYKQAKKAVTLAGHATRFWVKDELGRTIDIAAQKGKVVFINFWALSCVPCKAEMPSINQLHQHFSNDTNMLILPVDLDQDRVNSPAYMKEKGFGLTVYTAASAVPEAFFRGLLPTTVIIDKKGKIILMHEGEDKYDSKEFIARMAELSKQ